MLAWHVVHNNHAPGLNPNPEPHQCANAPRKIPTATILQRPAVLNSWVYRSQQKRVSDEMLALHVCFLRIRERYQPRIIAYYHKFPNVLLKFFVNK